MNQDILSVEGEYFRAKWAINDESRQVLQPIANEFGLSIESFLKAYTFRKLPGQLPNTEFAEEQDATIDLGLDLKSLRRSDAWKRISRAARFTEAESVKQFLTDAVMDLVRVCEENMVMSPRTGKPIAHEAAVDRFRIFAEYFPKDLND